jgi:two-component system sensor histidine kinase VicK
MNADVAEWTRVLYDTKDTNRALLRFYSRVNNRCDGYGISSSYSPSPLITKSKRINQILNRLKGKGVKLRYVTEITKDNVLDCKRLMEIVELRHLEGVKGNMEVSDTEYISPATYHNIRKTAYQILYSNVTEIVEQHQYLFDTLWNKAIPARQKIRELEKDIEAEFFEVFTDHQRVGQILLDLAKSVRKEALLILPNDKAMVRVDKLGVIDYVIKASQNGATVKIICPLSEENSEVVNKISENAKDIVILDGKNSLYGLYIADGEKLLRAELKEPRAEQFSEAIGFAIYSNSRRNADSFRSVFELLWNERILNERLKKAEVMQKEFINIASHEMKTPTQAILGYAEILERKPERAQDFIQPILRNAKRLYRLTNDILDVSKIESQSLTLKKERFNLSDAVSVAIEDIKNQAGSTKIKMVYEPGKEEMVIHADRGRLIQVISNLLSNAAKFTEEGKISIVVTASKVKDSNQNEVLISIRDNGSGIDSEIFPKLFSKFATHSSTGTGLGLFICKSIVEAHGGRIWAENNDSNGKKGATFTFSIPLVLN